MNAKQAHKLEQIVDRELSNLQEFLSNAATEGEYKIAVLDPYPPVLKKFDDALNQQNHSAHNLFQVVLRIKSMLKQRRHGEAMREIAQIQVLDYLYELVKEEVI